MLNRCCFENFLTLFFPQELLKAVDAHKSEVLSINLSSADFLQSEPDSEEAWELRDRLKEMNLRWDRLGTSLEDWREELQRALMQCQVRRLFYDRLYCDFFMTFLQHTIL